MARERFVTSADKKNSKGFIYGIGEIGLVFSFYGKNSKIYKAMVSGQKISDMIKESLKENKLGKKKNRDLEEKILSMCIDSENLVQKESVNVLF